MSFSTGYNHNNFERAWLFFAMNLIKKKKQYWRGAFCTLKFAAVTQTKLSVVSTIWQFHIAVMMIFGFSWHTTAIITHT